MITGIVFVSTVNVGVGIGILTVGITCLANGLKMKSDIKKKEE